MRKPLFLSHDSGVAMHRTDQLATPADKGAVQRSREQRKPCRQRLTISLLVHVTSKNTQHVQKCGVQPPSFASGHVHQRLCDASADQRSSLANVGSLKPQIVHQQKAKRNVDRLFSSRLFFSLIPALRRLSHISQQPKTDRQK